MTGLVDLREFSHLLDVEIGRATRHARPLSLALVGVDRLRDLTGDGGSTHGEAPLIAAGHLVERFLRAHDVACRADGGQFAVLLPETDAEGAFACFERLLLELDLTDVGPVSGLGASVGIATLAGGDDATGLFALAAQALDAVRAEGRGGAMVALTAVADDGAPARRGGPQAQDGRPACR